MPDIDSSELYRALIFMDDDPRAVEHDYVNFDPRKVGVEVVTFVVPLENALHGSGGYFRGFPIVTWEDPCTKRDRAFQYKKLYDVTKAEIAIHFGWSKSVPGSSEAGIVVVHDRVYEGLYLPTLERVLHFRIWGTMD